MRGVHYTIYQNDKLSRGRGGGVVNEREKHTKMIKYHMHYTVLTMEEIKYGAVQGWEKLC